MNKDQKLADHALWDEVRRTVRPLGTRGKRRSSAKAAAAAVAGVSASMHSSPVEHMKLPAPHSGAPVIPPLQALDRRTAQRLGRGQLEPEARIDLHGDSLENARVKLAHFISGQRQLGVRLVLVITGKGQSPFGRHTLHGTGHFHSPEREGRLRREVPRWLAEDHFRQHVVGFQPSHPRHGGGGAFYVRLRKAEGQWP